MKLWRKRLLNLIWTRWEQIYTLWAFRFNEECSFHVKTLAFQQKSLTNRNYEHITFRQTLAQRCLLARRDIDVDFAASLSVSVSRAFIRILYMCVIPIMPLCRNDKRRSCFDSLFIHLSPPSSTVIYTGCWIDCFAATRLTICLALLCFSQRSSDSGGAASI